MKKIEENLSNDVGSEAFKTLETDLNAFQETGIWNCSLCENKEKTFSHKFQLVTHWYETHSHKDAVFEVCQWCMELFFSPGSSAKVNNGILLQLNKYETAPNFIQFNQNLTSDCLLI